MPGTNEGRAKQDPPNLKHGAFALQERGEKALTPDERGLYDGVLKAMDTPAGVLQLMKAQAALGQIVSLRLAEYLAKEAASSDTPMPELPGFSSWATIHAVVMRDLERVADMEKTLPPDKGKSEEQERLDKLFEVRDAKPSG